MLGFSQEGFNEFVLKHGVIGFHEDPITLKSGRQSHWYVNWRKVVTDVSRKEWLANYVVAFVKELENGQGNLNAKSIVGVPEGATQIGLKAHELLVKTFAGYGPGSNVSPQLRVNPKEHGKPEDRYFVGRPEEQTVVLEDVTTTGGSLIAAVEYCMNADVNVVAAVGLTNRMQRRDDGRSVEEALREMGVPYHALSNAVDLLPLAYAKWDAFDLVKADIAREVEAEFEKYGVKSLRLGK